MQEDIIYIKPEKPVPSFLSFKKKKPRLVKLLERQNIIKTNTLKTVKYFKAVSMTSLVSVYFLGVLNI